MKAPNVTAVTEQFVKLPRDLLESAAWQQLGINARRFLDFLMIEHMRQRGKHNGFLLAPRRQLWEFGIGEHFVSSAIEEVETAGLVACRRGTGRRPSHYALTWLPLGTPPVVSAVSSENECSSALTKPVASAKRHSLKPKSSSAKQHSPSRRSYQGGANVSVRGKRTRKRVGVQPVGDPLGKPYRQGPGPPD
jgi:hypothetical protein